MLQASVLNVSSIFSEVCCKYVYLDVAYVSNIYYKNFFLNVAYVLQWLLSVFSFFATILNAWFKCFICLHTYLVNVSSRCFKSTLGVAHVAMAPMAGGQQSVARLRLLPHAVRLALSSPLSLLPSFLSISP
jgi:hypothetical protein